MKDNFNLYLYTSILIFLYTIYIYIHISFYIYHIFKIYWNPEILYYINKICNTYKIVHINIYKIDSFIFIIIL